MSQKKSGSHCLGLEAHLSLTNISLARDRVATLGVLPPLGVYDPLGLIETRDMRRYEIMVRIEDSIYFKFVCFIL